MKKNIFNKTHLSYIFVFVIGTLFMTMNVFASNISSDYKLDKDITESIEVKSGSKVTIDLNGKTINSSNHAIIINDGAIVTIKGNGNVFAAKSAILNKGGNVTIENGTFASSTYYTVKNMGTMTINGGTFNQTDDKNIGSSLIVNGWYNSTGTDDGVLTPDKNKTKEAAAIMTINGGVFNHITKTSNIKTDYWGKTTINGGTFNSKIGTILQATGEVSVTNGNFVGTDDVAMFNGDKELGISPATITITGGNFTAKYIIWTFTSGTLTIKDGTFNNVKSGIVDPYTKNEFDYNITGGLYNINSDIYNYLKEGYDAFDSSDGLIIDKTAVFKLNKKVYYVEKGKTIKLDYTANESAKKYANLGSADENIATIKNFIVTGMSVGKTNIDCFIGAVGEGAEVIVYDVKTDETTKNGTTDLNGLINELGNGKDEVKGLDKDTSSKLLDAVKNGKTIKTELSTKEIKISDLKQEIKEKVNKILKKEEKIAAYFDINVLLKADDNNIGKITELENAIIVSVDIPTNLPEIKTGYTRKYYVIRIHNGETTKIEANLVNGKIEFKTDKFSDYVLTYNDEIETKSENKGKLDDVPKTGNINYTIFFIIMGIMTLVSIKLLKRN